MDRGLSKGCLFAIVGLLVAGCSSAETLRDSHDIAPFVKSVAKGDGAKWQLATDASPRAKRAWRNRGSTQTIGFELRNGQARWGCRVLELLRAGHEKFQTAGVAESEGAYASTVNEMIGEADSLTPAELGDIVGAVCARSSASH